MRAALAIVVVAGCGEAARAPELPVFVGPCVPVHVVDEAGAPIAGAEVFATASAWVGPAGAFYIEGGHDFVERGAADATDVRGDACIVDPALKLAARREAAKRAAADAGSFAYIAGGGPDTFGRTRDTIVYVELPGWPAVTVARGAAPLVARIGPARAAHVTVRSACAPRSIDVELFAPGNTAIRAAARGIGASAADLTTFDFTDLGPNPYRVSVRSCDGLREATLDPTAAATLEIATRAR